MAVAHVIKSAALTCIIVLAASMSAQSEPNNVAATSALISAKTECPPSTICNDHLKYLEPSAKERLLRLWQYEYQLQEQPAFVNATVNGGGQQVIPNPEQWLQQHSVTLDFSELFPRTANLPKMIQAAYNDLPDTVRSRPVVLGMCKPFQTALECLADGGSNFWERFASGVKATFTSSQRSPVQQGVMLSNLTPSQGWAWGGEIDFDPKALFISASNWQNAAATISKGRFALPQTTAAATREGDCFDISYTTSLPKKSSEDPLLIRRNCIAKYAEPRLKSSIPQGSWTRFAAVVIPTFQFKVLSQFDFLKQGGVLLPSPLLQRSLKTITLKWDLRRTIPSTSERLAVGTRGDSGAKKGDSGGTASKLCVVISGTLRSYIGVASDSSITTCQTLANAMSSDHYAVACASPSTILIGSPIAVGEQASGGKLPASDCGWTQ